METTINAVKQQELRENKFDRISLYFDWEDREPGEAHITWEQWNKLRKLRIQNEENRKLRENNQPRESEEDEETFSKLSLIEKLEPYDIRTIIEAYNNRTSYKYWTWHGTSSGGVIIGGESYSPWNILFVIDYLTLNESVNKNGYYKTFSTYKEKINRKGNKCGALLVESKDKKKGSYQKQQRIKLIGKKDRKNGQKGSKNKNY